MRTINTRLCKQYTVKLVVLLLTILLIIVPVVPAFEDAPVNESSIPTATKTPIENSVPNTIERTPTKDSIFSNGLPAVFDTAPLTTNTAVGVNASDDASSKKDTGKLVPNSIQSGTSSPIPAQPSSSLMPKQVIPEPDFSTGALIYSYPITVPPGRNGFYPELNLSYNSQSQDDSSPYGYAWSLNIPSITRINKKGIDKLYSPSFSDWSFESSFDGELVLVSAIGTRLTYQARTEGGSFNLYALDTSNNAWTLTMKNGVVFLFGTTITSRQDNPANTIQVSKWFVDKQSDTNGNFISYFYTKDQGQVYPNYIAYTNTSTTTGIYKINFTYQARPDASVAYNQGFSVTTAKRLAQLEVTSNGSWARHYDVAYSISPNSGRSLIQSITESGRNDIGTTTQLPSTIFSYNQATAGLSEQSWTLPTIRTSCCQNGVPFASTIGFGQNGGVTYSKVIDINGDNLPDIIYSDSTITAVTPYQTAAQAWINNGSGWTLNSSWSFPVTNQGGGHQYTFAIDEHYTRFVDVNSDGMVDVITGGWGDLSATTPKTAVYINTGLGWVEDPSWQLPIIYSNAGINYTVSFNQIVDSSGNYGNPVRFTDINNDGKVDIVYATGCSGDICGTKKSAVILNTGSGWNIDPHWQLLAVQGAPGAPWNVSNLAQSSQPVHIADINGDGLPDILDSLASVAGECGYAQGGYFKNTGNGWVFDACWDHQNFPGNRSQLADVNNDGLVDVITADGLFWAGSGVFLNTGSGWAATDFWNFPLLGTMGCSVSQTFSFATGIVSCNQTIDGTSRVIDVNGDNLPDIFNGSSFGQILSTVGIYRNNTQNFQFYPNWAVGIPYFSSSTGDKAQPYDLNSDGLPDYVYSTGCIYNPSNCQDYSRVYINVGAKSDVLASLTIPSGATTSVTYKQIAIKSNATPTEGQGQSIYVVSTITTNDGMGVISNTSYAYDGGSFYSGGPTDRRFAGFNKIAITDSAGNVTNTYFHQGNSSDLTHGKYNDEYWKIGKPYRVEIASNSGNLYSKTINKWDSYDLGSGRKFVKLAQTLASTYDGDITHRDKAESYAYDNTSGNMTQKVEYGEVTGSDNGTFSDIGSDKFTTAYTYAANVAVYISGLPSQVITTDQSSAKVKETKFYYDLQALGSVIKGNLTKQEEWKTGTSYINRQKTYDSTYGLVTVDTDPRGKTSNYVYDTNNLYPATVSNALGQAIQYTYDYSSGQVTQKTDPNNRVFQSVYDGLGRVVEERQPDIASPNIVVTKATYTYTDTTNAMSVKKSSYLDASTIADSYIYFDGLGRKLQERKEAEGTNFVTQDYVYNNLGLLQKESLPYFSTGSSKTFSATDSNLFINYSYDPIQRVITTQNAIGTTTNTYDDWKLTVTDAKGNSKNLFKDAYGNLVKVEEFNSGNTYTTQYEYNGIGNLTKITDAQGNIRNFTYDGLGRRLAAQDLHAATDTTFGAWVYTYDDSGNLISKTDAKNQIINYTYDDLNRPLTEDYTGQSGIEVTYTYDSCLGGIGRQCSAINNNAGESRQYNALGLVAREIKTISSATYQTDYNYDRLGNVLMITNPDGSQIKYEYNAAGLLDRIRYKEAAWPNFSDIISNFDYSPLQAVTYQEHANGAKTTNTYDATKLYQLSSKVTTLPVTGGTTRIQDLNYTYDPNGNITQIADNSATNANKTVTYTYDALNRLMSATCTNAINGQNYAQSYTYDAIGNITSKNQGAYAYNSNQASSFANPHAVTSIGSTTNTYDKNGNLLSASGAGTSLPWYAADGTWTKRKQLTIDHTKVSGNADLSNFTMLVSVTDPELKSVANGGFVGKSDGSDILFTASNGTAKLSHEIEKYSPATGQLIAWVKVPTLSVAIDTALVIYYGNATATNQQDKPNTWDSNTKGVWHLNNSLADSTSNANNGANVGSTNSTSGKIGDARDFTALSNRVTVPNAASLKPTSQLTLSAWVKRNGSQVSYAKPLWFGQGNNAPWGPYGFEMDGASDTALDFHISSNSLDYYIFPTTSLASASWYYVTGTYDGTTIKYYINGTLQGSQAASFTIGNYDATNGLGLGDRYQSGEEWNGYVDEVKVASTARTQGWVQTEYNNQNSPGSFLTIGAVTSTGGPTVNNIWDYNNRLVQTANSNTTVVYTYDPQGQRVTYFNGSDITVYPSKNYNLTGTSAIKHIFAGDQLVATIRGDGSNAQVLSVHTDHLSGSSVISNQMAIVEEVTDYFPYGEIRLDEKASTFSEQRKFTGREYDTDTGLNYAGARYYYGIVGRFISQDPAFWTINQGLPDPQFMNSYSYAKNNPLIYNDPDGQWPTLAQANAILARSERYNPLNILFRADTNRLSNAIITGNGKEALKAGGNIVLTTGAIIITAWDIANISGDVATSYRAYNRYQSYQQELQAIEEREAARQVNNLVNSIDAHGSHEKHVIGINNQYGKEYGSLFQSKAQWNEYVGSVISKPSASFIGPTKNLYWDDRLGTIIINNKSGGSPTAFHPIQGRAYYETEVAKQQAQMKGIKP